MRALTAPRPTRAGKVGGLPRACRAQGWSGWDVRPEPHLRGPRGTHDHDPMGTVSPPGELLTAPALAEPRAEEAGIRGTESFQTRPSRNTHVSSRAQKHPRDGAVAAGVERLERDSSRKDNSARIGLPGSRNLMPCSLFARTPSYCCSEGFEMISEKGLYCSGSN